LYFYKEYFSIKSPLLIFVFGHILLIDIKIKYLSIWD